MADNKMTLISEKFKASDSEAEVDGITIIIDGKLKEVFDIIIKKHNKYYDYNSVLSDAIFMGINEIIKSGESS